MENAPPAAVLLDAFGTLVTFPDPAPRLRAELAARAGVDVGEAAARAAMRAEIDYYRAHHEEGRDAAAVTELRRRCGAEVARALGGAVGATVATEALLAAIAWRAYAEVPAVLRALRDAGCRLAVVSNWDAALSDVLGALGLLPFFDVVVASAPEGRSKPDPELFRRALDRLGVAPGDAVHVGDSEEHDVRGARAAGVAPVLLCRGGGGASGGHGAHPPRARRRDAHGAARAVGPYPARPMSADEPAARTWPWWLAPAGLALAVGVTLLVSILVLGVMSGAGLDINGRDKGVANIVATLIQDAAFVGAALFVVARESGGRVALGEFGLRRVRVRDGVLWAVVAGVSYAVFAVVWDQLAKGSQQDDLFKELGVHRHSFGIAVLAVLVCVVAPVAEEFFFRGFGFGVLRPRLGVGGAALAVGLVFGAVHAASTPVILLPELAFLGFVLCLLRWRTDSLVPCIALHATNNALAYGSLLNWGWQIPLLIAGSLAVLLTVLRPLLAPRELALGA